MAKAPTKTPTARPNPEAPPPIAPPPQTYEPEADYRVTLARSVAYAGRLLRAGSPRIVVKGSVAEQIKDAIKTAERL